MIEETDPNALRFARWRTIADKIEADPELLRVPLANIQRWLDKGQDAAQMLKDWRCRIEAAQASKKDFASLLFLLRSDDETARHLKSYSPFPGVLTSKEVDQFRCAYQH